MDQRGVRYGTFINLTLLKYIAAYSMVPYITACDTVFIILVQP